MWIVNALPIVCSEMLKLSRNNQNIKMLRVPPNTLPLVLYIGIFCYWVLLHYMSFKTIAGGFNGAFWWVWSTFWRPRKILTNLPKLSCGFKKVWITSSLGHPHVYASVFPCCCQWAANLYKLATCRRGPSSGWLSTYSKREEQISVVSRLHSS